MLNKNVDDKELQEYFKEYIASYGDKERHTKAACEEVTQFDSLVSYFFPKELKSQTALYNKMMDAAVEYEESGFMAGYRMCLKHLQEQAQFLQTKATNTTNVPGKEQKKLVTGSVDAEDFISSMQIAEMFGTSNFKVVRRINEQILPYCNDKERKSFTLTSEMNQQKKYIKVYRLSNDACTKYLEHMEQHARFANITEGIYKFQKMMLRTFVGGVPA